MHSAHLQMVEIRLNDPALYISPAGQLCEITVPYSTAYQYTKFDGWIPWRGSRLYYSSLHWATAVDAGPDGRAWYKIVNELSDTEVYFVPATHLRILPLDEWSPLSLAVPPEKKRIEISLKEQTLRAL